jgi:hypothetical protein
MRLEFEDNVTLRRVVQILPPVWCAVPRTQRCDDSVAASTSQKKCSSLWPKRMRNGKMLSSKFS